MHVRVALDRHQLVDFDRARHADAAEIVALEIDQHDVLGALLRMADRARARAPRRRRPRARARAGDRPRLREIAAHLDEAFRRRACDRPATALQQARERRRIRFAQRGVHGRGGRRSRATHAPFARQIDLEHVAGAQIFVDARDAVEEARGRILVDRARRSRRGDTGGIARETSAASVSSRSSRPCSATSRVDSRS